MYKLFTCFCINIVEIVTLLKISPRTIFYSCVKAATFKYNLLVFVIVDNI